MVGRRRGRGGANMSLVDSRTISLWASKVQHFATEVPMSVLGLHLHDLPSSEDVCSQSKILIRDFIYHRLKKHGLLSHRLELQTAPARSTDVAVEIQTLSLELEKLYPTLYVNVSRQLNVSLTSEKVVRKTLLNVADQMFRNSVVTWGRIVAMFSIAGALALECVQHGHPDLVPSLVDAFGDVTQKHLAGWITKQGGWADITRVFRTSKETSTLWVLTGVGAALGFVITLVTAFGI